MRRPTKEERVAEYLREGIIAGRWPRGHKLKQEEVALTLGLSITPVREAFQLLEAEGYLLGRARRGVVVAPFDVAAAEEVLELRVTLEVKLVLAALEHLDGPALDALCALQAEFESAVRAGDAHAVRSINYRFHRQLYAAAGRPETLRFVNILWARYPFDLINGVPGRIAHAAAEHGAILEAVLTGDRALLALALRQHIRSGWEEFARVQPLPAAEPPQPQAFRAG
jgi:DNA-binding GntR family transcriptional regulator